MHDNDVLQTHKLNSKGVSYDKDAKIPFSCSNSRRDDASEVVPEFKLAADSYPSPESSTSMKPVAVASLLISFGIAIVR